MWKRKHGRILHQMTRFRPFGGCCGTALSSSKASSLGTNLAHDLTPRRPASMPFPDNLVIEKRNLRQSTRGKCTAVVSTEGVEMQFKERVTGSIRLPRGTTIVRAQLARLGGVPHFRRRSRPAARRHTDSHWNGVHAQAGTSSVIRATIPAGSLEALPTGARVTTGLMPTERLILQIQRGRRRTRLPFPLRANRL